MSADEHKAIDVGTRVTIAFVVGFLLLLYNHEIAYYLMGRENVFMDGVQPLADKVSSADNLILKLLGIILGFLILVILTPLAALVGGLLWLIGKLTDIYVLPLVIVLLIATSSAWAYHFAHPLATLLRPLRAIGRFVRRLFDMFVLLPLAEVVVGRGKRSYRVRRFAMAATFSIGLLCLLVGIAGLATVGLEKTGLWKTVKSRSELPYYERFSVTVKASHPFWTRTGIKVHSGDRVSFESSGTIETQAPMGGRMSHGPEGVPQGGNSNALGLPRNLLPVCVARDSSYAVRHFILPDSPLNGLMAAVNEADPFYIGKSSSHVLKSDGELVLSINVPWLPKAWRDNVGSFQVSIVIRRG